MHALNLPASLLPQSPDGAAQTTATAADDPELLAMFEQALGLHVQTGEQAPAQALPANAASNAAAPAATGLTATSRLPITASLPQTTAQGASVVTLPATNLPSDANIPYAPPSSIVSTVNVDAASQSGTAVTVPAPLAGNSTTKPIDQMATATAAVPATLEAEGPANLEAPADGPLRVKSDGLLNDKAFYSNTLGADAVPAQKAPVPIKLEAATVQPSATTVAADVSTPVLGAPAESPVTSQGAETARPITAANPATEAPAIAQVRDTIRAGTRSGTIEVQLDPPELGRVLIELEVGRQGQVKAVISASESDTLDLMRRNGDTLAGDLKDSGFDDVELDWQQADQSSDDADGPQPLWLVNDTSTPTQSMIVSSRHDGALDIQL
ncbi:MAG: flagellar hook-length control protein FliK [Pseudomonadota bacterium]